MNASFDRHHVLHELKHYLPAQAPLKDFVHHNTLHAFQSDAFFLGLKKANSLFGYKTTLPLWDYRARFSQGEISQEGIAFALRRMPEAERVQWEQRMHFASYPEEGRERIGHLRGTWKRLRGVDVDALVHPVLFRLINSYLDQGIAIWSFPESRGNSFWDAVVQLEQTSAASLLRSSEVRAALVDSDWSMEDLLAKVVGDPSLFEHYLFDQQFSHQGWSGMVATIEELPQSLLDQRTVRLEDFIKVELLLEWDALWAHEAPDFKPLAACLDGRPESLFADVEVTEKDEVLRLWQEAMEWSFYDTVLLGLVQSPNLHRDPEHPRAQAFFCIDDRECSFRRHLEGVNPEIQTFGTPGFFGIDTYFLPEGAKFPVKVCPAPVTPKHGIKSLNSAPRRAKERNLEKGSHSFWGGWIFSQTLGFLALFRLAYHLIRPSKQAGTSLAFDHVDPNAKLTVGHDGAHEGGLQIGYTLDEQADRVSSVLTTTGLTSGFAPLVYLIGHGASSTNNPHFAAYDCGACSGRAGSVNARAFCVMANDAEVRARLAQRGIAIPDTTRFVPGLRDTTRDEIAFYDLDGLSAVQQAAHASFAEACEVASGTNAQERSRRFEALPLGAKASAARTHVRRRSASLFEPRPELNHATNALAIVAPRAFTDHVFLDRRAFLNSYDPAQDPEGYGLQTILGAAAPVCGGINLEYYFSRVDNQRLGAGTKLPHNVMGLIGVANGIDGDLRPGLPSQMIEVHDPLRLMLVVVQRLEILDQVLQRAPATRAWFDQEWIHLVAIDPTSREISRYLPGGTYERYEPFTATLPEVESVATLVASSRANIPVHLIRQTA
ncbi:MAG: YbcC family protein [Schleiferiaceae bacterium]